MIYINYNGNYSNVAVGTVDVPVTFESETEAILAKYSKTITTAEQIALNTLVLFLKNNSLYNKLSFFALPCFAGSIAEALTDVKNDAASTYNASTHTNISLKTYGIQVANLGNTTPMPKIAFTDTAIKTIACLWYKESDGSSVTADIGDFWYCGSNIYVKATEVLGSTNAFPTGMNIEIMGSSGTTYTASNIFRYINGTSDTVTVDSSIEGNSITLDNYVRIGSGKWANSSSVCGWNTQTALLMVFNDSVDSSLATALNDAISAFEAVITEING